MTQKASREDAPRPQSLYPQSLTETLGPAHPRATVVPNSGGNEVLIVRRGGACCEYCYRLVEGTPGIRKGNEPAQAHEQRMGSVRAGNNIKQKDPAKRSEPSLLSLPSTTMTHTPPLSARWETRGAPMHSDPNRSQMLLRLCHYLPGLAGLPRRELRPGQTRPRCRRCDSGTGRCAALAPVCLPIAGVGMHLEETSTDKDSFRCDGRCPETADRLAGRRMAGAGRRWPGGPRETVTGDPPSS